MKNNRNIRKQDFSDEKRRGAKTFLTKMYEGARIFSSKKMDETKKNPYSHPLFQYILRHPLCIVDTVEGGCLRDN